MTGDDERLRTARKRSISISRDGKRYVKGAHVRAVAAGDFDGDGVDDLLLGNGLTSYFMGQVDPHWILFGRSPLDPVDLASPGPGLTKLPDGRGP